MEYKIQIFCLVASVSSGTWLSGNVCGDTPFKKTYWLFFTKNKNYMNNDAYVKQYVQWRQKKHFQNSANGCLIELLSEKKRC